MPTYEFECVRHGTFDLIRLMRESAQAGECPTCGKACERTVTAPNLRLLAGGIRNAMDRNEKSRHAPRVGGPECSHKHTRAKSRGALDARGKPKLQAYRGRRPWVVEHA